MGRGRGGREGKDRIRKTHSSNTPCAPIDSTISLKREGGGEGGGRDGGREGGREGGDQLMGKGRERLLTLQIHPELL